MQLLVPILALLLPLHLSWALPPEQLRVPRPSVRDLSIVERDRRRGVPWRGGR